MFLPRVFIARVVPKGTAPLSQLFLPLYRGHQTRYNSATFGSVLRYGFSPADSTLLKP